MTLNCGKSMGWHATKGTFCGIALLSFAAGALIATGFSQVTEVRAESNRVFELRIYHCVPGKVPALESRFRDTTSKILAKHDLNAVGYWVPEDTPAWDNTFVLMVAHSSREDAKKHWDAMQTDPEFQQVMKSELSDKLVEKVDSTYMRPTDFSAME